jgi:hypothetical protein
MHSTVTTGVLIQRFRLSAMGVTTSREARALARAGPGTEGGVGTGLAIQAGEGGRARAGGGGGQR